MSKFTWGKIIDRFDYDFDGTILNVIKYHPWEPYDCRVRIRVCDANKIQYHCEELNEAHESIDSLLVSWMVRKNLGHNQWALVSGICRALDIKNFE
jgi:hypothetical protein